MNTAAEATEKKGKASSSSQDHDRKNNEKATNDSTKTAGKKNSQSFCGFKKGFLLK